MPARRRGAAAAKAPGAPRKDPKIWAPKLQSVFAKTGKLQESLKAVGLGYDTYRQMRKDYPWVEEGHVRAQEQYVESLEAEAHRRGVTGVQRPYLYKGEMVYRRDPDTGELVRDSENQPIPIMIHEYSDRMLELMLKAEDPEKYRENQRSTGDDVGRVLVVPASQSMDAWMENQQKRKANSG